MYFHLSLAQLRLWLVLQQQELQKLIIYCLCLGYKLPVVAGAAEAAVGAAAAPPKVKLCAVASKINKFLSLFSKHKSYLLSLLWLLLQN
jgi:hypothetical protein